MSAEALKTKLIHILMEEAYEEGIEEGKRQALEQIKTLKEQNHKLRMDKDFSHNPERNIYAKMP